MKPDRWAGARPQQAFQKASVLYKEPLKSLKQWNGAVRLAFSKDISGCHVKNGVGGWAGEPNWRWDFTVIRGGMGAAGWGSDRGHTKEEWDLRGIWEITRSCERLDVGDEERASPMSGLGD